MPQQESLTVLLINDLGEEVKLVTLSFRRFFSGCRVEVAYSLEEALQWTPRADWDLILVDERLTAERSTPVFPELKRLAPYATLVLQTDRSDSTAAVNALQAGADFLLYKKSSAFLTELMLYTKGAIETRGLRIALERTQERHNRLVDTLADVLYELDAEGRFVYVSPSITPLLGYAPEELMGAPYSTVLAPDQLERVQHRFDDRRTGGRASRRIEVELAAKTTPEGQTLRVLTELSAKGLYDAQRRYLGTLGLLRDISHRRQQEHHIARLERQLHEKERVVQAAQRLSSLSTLLQAPLAAILSQSQQLLSTIQEAKLDQQVDSLLRQATEAVRQGAALADTAHEGSEHPPTLHDILDQVLAAITPPMLERHGIERRYAASLPPFPGDIQVATQLFRILLTHALRYVAAVDRRHGLRLTTGAVGPTGAPLELQPTLFPTTQAAGVEVRIEETEPSALDGEPPVEAYGDLFQAYHCVQQLGGRLDFHVPSGGLFSMTVWLPAALRPDQAPDATPSAAVTEAPPSDSSSIQFRPSPQTAPVPEAFTPPPDRRRALRVPVHVPAKITIGSVTREGTVTWLGPGGASLEVEDILPSVDEQPAYIVLKTAVGLLELQGTAHDRGRSKQAGANLSVLALRFTGTGAVEQQVLTSLIEEARARTLSLTLEALLTLPEGPAPDRSAGDDGITEPDHRESLRVRVALPARVETGAAAPESQRPLALVVNVSRGGAALQMRQEPGAIGDRVSLHFSAADSFGHPRVHEPDAPEAVLSAQIVWTGQDHAVPSELRPQPAQPGRRIGLQFRHVRPFVERDINRVMAQHVGSSIEMESIAGHSSIVSARRECRNARQQVIAITDDHARHQISPATPVVIVVPGFGRTQTDYLPLSFFLAVRRIRVLRYDHTNHIGQSDGDALQTTLRSMQVDLQRVIEFTRTTWPTASLTILAEDIGARVALKVLGMTGIDALPLLVDPVLDLQAALTSAYRHDVLADHQQGLRRGAANLWGLNVNLDQFLEDALAGHYTTLSGSTEDYAVLRTPPVIVTTPHPAEAARGQVEPALRALGRPPAVLPLGAPLFSPPSDAQTAAFQALYTRIAAHAQVHASEALRPTEPREIRRQRHLEHERLRLRHHVSQSTRDALWIAHMAQLPELSALHDFLLLGEHLYRQLLPLEPGTNVLDLGCGRGDLARVILTNQAYRLAHRSRPPQAPLRYVGLGRSHDSVTIAERSVTALAQELRSAFASGATPGGLLDTAWAVFEWDSPLPFRDGSFDRIVCHLSLCFSPSPLSALREALRVLAPQGTLLMTCVQPHTDLSPLYRRHLHMGRDEFSVPGQIVLHYLGRLREAIRHGILHSYGREDLDALLLHAGASPSIEIRSMLDGQLLVARAHKVNSPG